MMRTTAGKRHAARRAVSRRAIVERLESRFMLASDWHNSCAPLDVSDDGIVSPFDALLQVNRINSVGSGKLPPVDSQASPPPYFDTNDDGLLAPLDVLQIINALNSAFSNSTFTFEAGLTNDTGAGEEGQEDFLTADARISGRITSVLGLSSFQARVDGGSLVDVHTTCGSFTFDPDLNLDGGDDGSHVVAFTARDPKGREASFDVQFTLDTSPPVLILDIANEHDTGIKKDYITSQSNISLTGHTEPGLVVAFEQPTPSVVADDQGSFQISNLALNPLANTITARAIDLAGNEAHVEQSITMIPCDFSELNEGLIAEDRLPAAGDAVPEIGWGDLLHRAAGDGFVGVSSALLDQNHVLDLVTVSQSTNEVLVYLGKDGLLQEPVRYASGASEPVTVSVANFVGNAAADIAVGHLDGTVVFLEGQGDGTFTVQPDARTTGLGAIYDLSAHDLDGDGDIDLVVSASSSVSLLTADDDSLTSNPIVNGDFSQGTVGWNVDRLRQGSPADLRGIQTGGGSVHLMESDSLLTSIWQTFVVPPDPQQLSFEVLDVQLDQSTGGLPDALDVSLLDDQSQSLVPVATSGATAFFNLNPNDRVSVAPGVTWDGTNVTLDISQLTPGTSATLVFDLVGNQPLTNSVVTMDNVRVTPEAIYQDTFTASPLTGPFNNASSIYHCSYDGNNSHDIVVEDASLGGYVLFASNGAGGFTRDENVFGDKGAGGEGENDGRPIQIGEIVAHRIDEVGEIDGFTFEATSGQRLFLDDQGLGFNLFWRLLDPFGNQVFHELLSDHGVVTLTGSGTYTLQIESGIFNATGPYQFQIYDVPATSTTAVAFSTPVVGAIDVPGAGSIHLRRKFRPDPVLRRHTESRWTEMGVDRCEREQRFQPHLCG